VLSDEALADELDPPGGLAPTGDAVEVFLRRWLANPLFAGISPEADGFDERLRNTAAGLAASLRLAGTGTQQPLWDRLGRLEMPVLIITGERDDKFTALGRRMAEAIGANATHVVIAEAGHAPHLQRPGQVGALIRRHAGAGRR
jgi:pimeloyl-ACP methyl ester carboxylesterase